MFIWEYQWKFAILRESFKEYWLAFCMQKNKAENELNEDYCSFFVCFAENAVWSFICQKRNWASEIQ